MIEALRKFFKIRTSLPTPTDSEIDYTAPGGSERFVAKIKYKSLSVSDDYVLRIKFSASFISHPRSSNKNRVEFYEDTHVAEIKIWVYDITRLDKEGYKKHIESILSKNVYIKGCDEYKKYRERVKLREENDLEIYKRNLLKNKIKEWR